MCLQMRTTDRASLPWQFANWQCNWQVARVRPTAGDSGPPPPDCLELLGRHSRMAPSALRSALLVALICVLCSVESANGFSPQNYSPVRATSLRSSSSDGPAKTSPYTRDAAAVEASTIWEKLALNLVDGADASSQLLPTNPADLKEFTQTVTLLRTGAPALAIAATLSLLYTPASLQLASIIDDSDAFNVIANDASQYIQNILTTCGLTFSILVGQTFYFMYQQTEAIYLALFEEVTAAKALLEQVSLVSQGREDLNTRIITAIRRYVQEDLRQLQSDPAELLSSRPMDDPLESIMYLTSVGEPSVVYESVRALRQARAKRLGALQRKLPEIQMILLWSLAAVVLSTFPLLGAGVQTLGGMGILNVQSIYLTFIVFGISLTMGVINELRKPAGGVYNVDAVLNVMVGGLEEELDGRLNGKYRSRIPTMGMDATKGSEELAVNYGMSLKSVAGMEEDTTIVEADESINDYAVEEEPKPWLGKRIVRRIKNREKA